MNVAFFLARHFYKTPGSGKRISGTTLHIATAGVAAGLAVMIISVCVVLGFKNEIRSKVIGFGAHIEVINTQSLANPQAFPLTDGAGLARLAGTTPGVRNVQRFATATGLLKGDGDGGITAAAAGTDYQAPLTSGTDYAPPSQSVTATLTAVTRPAPKRRVRRSLMRADTTVPEEMIMEMMPA